MIDNEKILVSILKESPIYSGLQLHERLTLIKNLMHTYSHIFNVSCQKKEVKDNAILHKERF
jgi:hypothetical protein